MGADCILLILAALADDEVRELETLARAMNLDVLAEVHDRTELDRALGLQTKMIGNNNRNLKTLKTDVRTTLELAGHVPRIASCCRKVVSRTHADIQALAKIGVRAFLVGESLLRQPDVTRRHARAASVMVRWHDRPEPFRRGRPGRHGSMSAASLSPTAARLRGSAWSCCRRPWR